MQFRPVLSTTTFHPHPHKSTHAPTSHRLFIVTHYMSPLHRNFPSNVLTMTTKRWLAPFRHFYSSYNHNDSPLPPRSPITRHFFTNNAPCLHKSREQASGLASLPEEKQFVAELSSSLQHDRQRGDESSSVSCFACPPSKIARYYHQSSFV